MQDCNVNYLRCSVEDKSQCVNRDACFEAWSIAVFSQDPRILQKQTKMEYLESTRKERHYRKR